MPNDLTPTVMDAVKTSFYDVFKNQANVMIELTNNPITAPLMAQRQMVRTEPIKDGAENCIGAKVYYLKSDNLAESTMSTSPIASDCELTTGDGVSSFEEIYNINLYSKEYIRLNDADCGNLVQFQDKLRRALPDKMTNISQAINTSFVNFLESNKTVPNAAYLTDGVTIAGGDYTITGAEYWSGDKVQDTLAIAEKLAADHGLHDYFIVTGNGLRIAQMVSGYNSQNTGTTQFGTNAAFGQFEVFFDTKFLDQIVTGTNLFIVDPRSYVFVPTNSYSPQTVATGDQYNTMIGSMPLQYFNQFDKDNFQLSTFMYANNGTMQPVMIDMVYQKSCNRDSDPNFKYKQNHTWELEFNGCLYPAPNDGTNTGMIKIVQA